MTLKETMKQLEALADEKVRAYNIRNGAGENQFGVIGDIHTEGNVRVEPDLQEEG